MSQRVPGVDDDKDTLYGLEELLESPGVEVSAAENGEEAEALLKSTAHHVVMADLMLGSFSPEAGLKLALGEEQVIPGFEQALIGMVPGDSKTVTIPADQAYGAHDADLSMAFEREGSPEDLVQRRLNTWKRV